MQKIVKNYAKTIGGLQLVKKEEGRNVATIPRDYQRGGYKRAYYITLQQDEITA